MVRKLTLILAICAVLDLAVFEGHGIARQSDTNAAKESTKKKASSRKKGKDSSSAKNTKTAPTPLKPMLDRDAQLQDDLEATPDSTGESAQSATQQLSVRTKVTAPDQTFVNQLAPVRIAVTNRGSALTDSAVLVVSLPSHVQLHASDPQLTRRNDGSYEYLFHEFAEKETQEFALEVVATAREPIQVRAQVQMMATQEIEIHVDRPTLKVDVTAPESSVQNAENLYSIDLLNESPIELTQVRVIAEVPEGLQVTTLNRTATIDEQNRTMTWELGDLGVQVAELIQFKAIALESATQHCRITIESAESEPREIEIATAIESPGVEPNTELRETATTREQRDSN